jgi:hypothetical protein
MLVKRKKLEGEPGTWVAKKGAAVWQFPIVEHQVAESVRYLLYVHDVHAQELSTNGNLKLYLFTIMF